MMGKITDKTRYMEVFTSEKEGYQKVCLIQELAISNDSSQSRHSWISVPASKPEPEPPDVLTPKEREGNAIFPRPDRPHRPSAVRIASPSPSPIPQPGVSLLIPAISSYPIPTSLVDKARAAPEVESSWKIRRNVNPAGPQVPIHPPKLEDLDKRNGGLDLILPEDGTTLVSSPRPKGGSTLKLGSVNFISPYRLSKRGTLRCE